MPAGSPLLRRRNRSRGEGEGEPEFQVAPMADLLFVLLVFFMSITTVEMLRTDKSIALPIAPEGKENKQKSHQVVVNVRWNVAARTGALSLDDRRIESPAALAAPLAARLAADPRLRVLIRADRAVEYSYTAEILKACGQAKVGDVAFAVLDGKKAPPLP
jgi:biopolymer transport protein ExbD